MSGPSALVARSAWVRGGGGGSFLPPSPRPSVSKGGDSGFFLQGLWLEMVVGGSCDGREGASLWQGVYSFCREFSCRERVAVRSWMGRKVGA